jgi:hypothetical protein
VLLVLLHLADHARKRKRDSGQLPQPEHPDGEGGHPQRGDAEDSEREPPGDARAAVVVRDEDGPLDGHCGGSRGLLLCD